MRKRIGLMAVIVVLFFSAGHTPAQDDMRVAYLNALAGSGWTGVFNTADVSITARGAAVFDSPLAGVLKDAKSLTARHAEALADIVRITVKTRGWLSSVPVEPGVYKVGLQQGPHNPQMALRNEKGSIVRLEPIYLGDPVTQTAQVGGEGAGNVQLFAAWGRTVFYWYYLSGELHDQTVGVLNEIKAGTVSLHTDINRPEVHALAQEANKSLAVHADLLGHKAPDQTRFHIYLFGKSEDFLRTDKLLTNGQFANQAAFTAEINNLSYIWFHTLCQDDAFSDFGVPLKIRELVLHELHHQYAFWANQDIHLWPLWLQEGLAERAAYECMLAVDKAVAARIEAYQAASYECGLASGLLPSMEDFFGWKTDGAHGYFYSMAFMVVSRLRAQGDKFKAYLKVLGERQTYYDVMGLARGELEARFGSPAKLAPAAAKTMSAKSTPHSVLGEFDHVGNELRVISSPNQNALCVFPQTKEGAVVEFSVEFAFHPKVGNQVDLVLSFSQGRKHSRFIKLAIMPDYIQLFSFREGQWTSWKGERQTPVLAREQTGKPLWHSVSVKLDNSRRLMTVSGVRQWSCELPEIVPIAETRCGVGVHNGIARFRNWTIK